MQAGLAFASGVLTVAAPCVLPLLPVVLGAGVAGGAAGGVGAPRQAATRPLFIALGFALSFAVVALVFGSAQRLLGLEQQTVRDVASCLLVAFGLSMIWPQPFQRLTQAANGWLSRVARVGDGAGADWSGGLLVGLSLGAVWTPCAGPVLATILTMVASQTHWNDAVVLVAVYALGAALPMLGIAYGGQFALTHVRALTRHAHLLQRLLGVVVVATGLLTLLQYDTVVTVWLADFFPSLAQGL